MYDYIEVFIFKLVYISAKNDYFLTAIHLVQEKPCNCGVIYSRGVECILVRKKALTVVSAQSLEPTSAVLLP